MTPVTTLPQKRRGYARLLQGFRDCAGRVPGERWEWLEAAHVLGQFDLRLHLASHAEMLKFAVVQRDWPEAGGQLLRLALVPLGHLRGNLPAGNIGRASVSAFRPMPLTPALRARIVRALR